MESFQKYMLNFRLYNMLVYSEKKIVNTLGLILYFSYSNLCMKYYFGRSTSQWIETNICIGKKVLLETIAKLLRLYYGNWKEGKKLWPIPQKTISI